MFVVAAAQEEMGRLDVLVCGKCHSVFHFVEEFQEHRSKEAACTGVSHFRENANVSNLRSTIFFFSMTN